MGVFVTADREGDNCRIGELRANETRAGEAEAAGEAPFLRRNGGIFDDYFPSNF